MKFNYAGNGKGSCLVDVQNQLARQSYYLNFSASSLTAAFNVNAFLARLVPKKKNYKNEIRVDTEAIRNPTHGSSPNDFNFISLLQLHFIIYNIIF